MSSYDDNMRLDPNKIFRDRDKKCRWELKILTIQCQFCDYKKLIRHSLWLDNDTVVVCPGCGRTKYWDIINRR